MWIHTRGDTCSEEFAIIVLHSLGTNSSLNKMTILSLFQKLDLVPKSETRVFDSSLSHSLIKRTETSNENKNIK